MATQKIRCAIYTRKSTDEGLDHHRLHPLASVGVREPFHRSVRQYLEQQAARQGFRLLSTEKYVAPNVARNLAWSQSDTKYVAFVDVERTA